MKAQQYGCPDKKCVMITVVDMPMGMGMSYKLLPLDEEPQEINGYLEKE